VAFRVYPRDWLARFQVAFEPPEEPKGDKHHGDEDQQPHDSPIARWAPFKPSHSAPK